MGEERADSRWRARAILHLERGAVITRLRSSCGPRPADFKVILSAAGCWGGVVI